MVTVIFEQYIGHAIQTENSACKTNYWSKLALREVQCLSVHHFIYTTYVIWIMHELLIIIACNIILWIIITDWHFRFQSCSIRFNIFSANLTLCQAFESFSKEGCVVLRKPFRLGLQHEASDPWIDWKWHWNSGKSPCQHVNLWLMECRPENPCA